MSMFAAALNASGSEFRRFGLERAAGFADFVDRLFTARLRASRSFLRTHSPAQRPMAQELRSGKFRARPI